MADVTVLMVGGRRCGKSSILASMESMLVNNPILNNYISIRPQGNHDLHEKKNKLVDFVTLHQKGSYYLVDFDASTGFKTYTFKVKHPRAWVRNFTIEFIDCPGEVFGKNPREDFKTKLEELIKKVNIFLVVVDTPYLMESSCGNFMKVNETTDIAAMFNEVRGISDGDFRKVIFIPVKCEKWKNQLNDVAIKLQSYYSELFAEKFPSWKNFSYNILPVLTAGGIEFGEFSEPQLLSVNDFVDPITSCCKQQGNAPFVRMYDGSSHVKKSGEKVVKNTMFIESGIPFYSWFKNFGKYEPKNCDQIAYHVIRFALFYMLYHRGAFDVLTPSKTNLKAMIQEIERNLVVDNDTANGIVPFTTNESKWPTL